MTDPSDLAMRDSVKKSGVPSRSQGFYKRLKKDEVERFGCMDCSSSKSWKD